MTRGLIGSFLCGLAAVTACGGGDATSLDGGATSRDGGAIGGRDGSATALDAATPVDADTSDLALGGDTLPPAGNPDGHCTTLPVPAEAKPVDTSKPTTVVGSGAPSSCTEAALAAAVKKGGVVTFSCGPGLVTIPLTAPLTPPLSNAYAGEPATTTVLDGGGKVTLDGQGKTRVVDFVHMGSWRKNDDLLVLQHLRVVRGTATPTMAIPACPPSGGISNADCSTGFDDGEGGAIDMRDGALRLIDVTFEDNHAALLGPDTGGGALYGLGSAHPIVIASCTFRGNSASNGGAIGLLWAGALVVDTLFDGNQAVGHGANSNEPTKCTCMHAGQNQTGSGGNGGAIAKDGADGDDLTLCGAQLRDNVANEFGGSLFLTADGSSAKLVIDDTLVTHNMSGHPYWQWCPSVSTDNPHMAGSSSGAPSPVNSTFCDTQGVCSSTCSS